MPPNHSPNISHYNVDLPQNPDLVVHFNNVKSKQQDHALNRGIKAAGRVGPSSGVAVKHLDTTTSVYRKMCNEEAIKTVKNNGFVGQARGTNSRKYCATSRSKVLEFENKGVPLQQRLTAKVAQVKVDKKYYKSMREACIDQHDASKINPTANVTNTEGLANTDHVNIGIHATKLDEFNRNIKEILVFNPDDPFIKNKFLHYVSNNKIQCSLIALSVVIEGYNICIALYEDGGIGKSTVVHVAGLGGSVLGSKIGAALGTMVAPGIGTAIACFVGGIIGSFVASGVVDFFCCLFSSSPIAQGEGPPSMEFSPFIYGAPETEFEYKSFGVPELEFKSTRIFGPPPLEFPNKNAFGLPEMEFENYTGE